MDGSTITVMVDGQALGHPNYNQFRSDIANLFPGYTNSQGAVGFFYIDMTKFSACVHTISWVVYDNASRGDGIGSRYFTVSTGAGNFPTDQEPQEPVVTDGVRLRRGIDLNGEDELLQPDIDGMYFLEIEESGRIELQAGVTGGYSLVSDAPQDLPAGSSFKRGAFFWQPGPGFLGDYRLVLTRPDGEKLRVRVRVRPKTFSSTAN